MSGWKYNLYFEGKILRSLINKEDETIENVIAICNQLITCLKTWRRRLRHVDKEEWEYDIETMIDDLKCFALNLEDDTLSYEEAQENLNLWLGDFYDMCDLARVLIGI